MNRITTLVAATAALVGAVSAQQCRYRRPQRVRQPNKAGHRHDGGVCLDMGEVSHGEAGPDRKLLAAPAELLPAGPDAPAQVAWPRYAVATHLPAPFRLSARRQRAIGTTLGRRQRATQRRSSWRCWALSPLGARGGHRNAGDE